MAKIKRIDHVAIAVKDADEATQKFVKLLNAVPIRTEILEEKAGPVKVSYVQLGDNVVSLIQSMEDLTLARQEALDRRRVEAQRQRFHLRVSLGSCGIAAGARDTLEALRRMVEEKTTEFEASQVEISSTGCLGLCALEPVVLITFQLGGQLRFIDPRTFGEMFVTERDSLSKVTELSHLGIDPLEHAVSWEQFWGLITQKHAKLKPLLMDQKFMAGIGNIYSDEILWGAGLRWDRMSDALSAQEVRRLYRSMVEVLQDAMKYRGSSWADEQYVDLFGKPGEYQFHHKVYARDGETCRRCRQVIVRDRVGGHSTYFCPACQV